MSLEGIQNEKSVHTKAFGYACSVCDCEAYDLGIGTPTVVFPDRRISVSDYFSRSRAKFSLEEVETHWRDYAIEPERLFEFLKSQTEQDVENEAVRYADAGTDVLVSCQTSSDLAVRAGKELLRARPEAAAQIEGIIYYSATLSSTPAWSTPCRLHFELGLKCETAFMVGQKGANATYAALRVGAEMLQVEDIRTLLLVGSERFAPPHSRMFSVFSVQGDSASAMLLGRGVYDYKLCCITLHDFAERPPNPANSTRDEIFDYWSETAFTALSDLVRSSGLQRRKVPLVVPPNCGTELLRRIAAKMGIPWEKFELSALRNFGSLGSSDLAFNLDGLSQSGAIERGAEIISFGFSSEGSVCGCVLRYEPRRGAR